MLATGRINRVKKFNFELRGDYAVLVESGVGSSIPLPVANGKYLFDWHRRKQFAKCVTADFLRNGFVSDRELVEHLMGVGVIDSRRLIVLAALFDKSAWKKGRKNGKS